MVLTGITLDRRHEFPEDVGILIEKPGFLPQKSGFQTLQYLSKIRNTAGRERIREVLELVGLAGVGQKPVGKYSMGMRQRLGLAQALLENPGILLLDEPMNGLDDHGAHEMRDLLMQLRSEDRTILLASHIREDIQTLCDVVYRIDSGRIVLIQVS